MHQCACKTHAHSDVRMPASVFMDALYAQDNIYITMARHHLIQFTATSRGRVNIFTNSCHVYTRMSICLYASVCVCQKERQTERVCVHVWLVFQGGLWWVWFPTVLIRVVITENGSPQMEHIPPSHYQGYTQRHAHTVITVFLFMIPFLESNSILNL